VAIVPQVDKRLDAHFKKYGPLRQWQPASQAKAHQHVHNTLAQARRQRTRSCQPSRPGKTWNPDASTYVEHEEDDPKADQEVQGEVSEVVEVAQDVAEQPNEHAGHRQEDAADIRTHCRHGHGSTTRRLHMIHLLLLHDRCIHKNNIIDACLKLDENESRGYFKCVSHPAIFFVRLLISTPATHTHNRA
jgi:hypothetical protein